MTTTRFARSWALAAFALFALAGASRAVAGIPCDLALVGLDVDYDSRNPQITPGPGRSRQDLNLVVAVENTGLLPIIHARVFVSATNGNCETIGPIEVDDFDGTMPGNQQLPQGDIYLMRLFVPSDAADCCGVYTFVATNDVDALRCLDGAIVRTGDGDSSNDVIMDLPDADMDPSDDVTPDVFVIEPINFSVELAPGSEVIEDITTERLRVIGMIDTMGPAPVSGTFFFDLVDAMGEVVIADVVAPATRRFNAITRTREISINLANFDVVPRDTPLRLAVRFGGPEAAATCGVAVTDTFTVDP